ncbi:glycosyltransferase [Agromyces sp. Marseille-Q5079]|uniref:glycosyltransferase n=1 Tax=Agromyces sp. Marseille-Q5079 TaxID=3439059 RepID=UPI003D9CBD8A
MFPRVTAVLVARHGGDRLRHTLEAIGAQRRRPDVFVIVLTHPEGGARELAADAGATHIVESGELLSFGDAVTAGERVLDAPADESDALWLLAEDSAPDPDALDRLLATLVNGRTVAVAGPKLVRWDEPDQLVGLGRTMTRFGRSVPVVPAELDQGQHDHQSDVLGVDPAGVLVRHTVWQALGGFDPALPSVDDGLDLGVRARLAGHRVIVEPSARVLFAGDGVAGPQAGARGSVRRRRDRLARAAALHRRLVYAPAAAVPLHWLTFLPLAVVRSIVMLLGKKPGAIIGEFGAALGVMFGFGRVARSRRALAAARTTGWSAVAPLRLQPDEARRRREAAAEARRIRARGRADDVAFIGSGGGWVLLFSVVASVVLFSWMLGAGGIGGGGLLPLSNGLDELWRNAAYGWRDIGAGFTGAADPFAAVLALLGSLAFWAPSFAMVALWLLALPAAALGAWFTASRLSERGSVRALAALLWMFAPMFLAALAEGRPGAVLAHVLLGWLAYAALGAARSWSSSATAALLFAAVIAAAPSLAPVLVIGWLVALAVSGRAAVRLAWLPVPALALALPLIVEQFTGGSPISTVADPGLPFASAAPTAWELALGLPEAGWGGWPDAVAAIPALAGLDAFTIMLVLTGLMVPLALVALAAFLARGIRVVLLAAAVVIGGFATAFAATLIAVAIAGDEAIGVWAGAGLSFAWLGMLVAVVVAVDALPRFRAALGAVLTVCVVLAVMPTLGALATGSATVGAAPVRSVPAFVEAEAEADPRVATLRMEPLAGGGLRATLEHGTGETLDDQSTIAQTRTELTDDERELASVAGNLASRSGFDADAAVREFGVSFVLLEPGADTDAAAVATAERARVALDGNPALISVGETDFGTLWRFVDAEADAAATQIPLTAGWPGGVITAVQLIVLLATLLLSIPTGAGREEDRRRVRPKRARAEKPIAALPSEVEVEDGDVPPEVEPSPEAEPSPDGEAADATAAGDGPDESAVADDPANVAGPEDSPEQAPDGATQPGEAVEPADSSEPVEPAVTADSAEPDAAAEPDGSAAAEPPADPAAPDEPADRPENGEAPDAR